MAHDSVGSNVSLLHEKMKTGGRTELLHPRGLNEQTSHAQILDAGQIAISIALMYYVAVRTITVE
jgi:hypothetical protein